MRDAIAAYENMAQDEEVKHSFLGHKQSITLYFNLMELNKGMHHPES